MSETRMTQAEALTEARRRWGPRGTVVASKRWDDDLNDGVGGEEDYCLVGVGDWPLWEERGEGWSWVEAFLDADRRGHR